METQDKIHPFTPNQFQKQLHQFCQSLLTDFKKIIKFPIFINLCFLSLLVAEISIFIAVIHSNSFFIAAVLGIIFLTVFTQLLLHFYFQTKKPEQFAKLQEKFIQSCKCSLDLPVGEIEHHLSVSSALMRAVSRLSGIEKHLYKSYFSATNVFVEKFGNKYHYEDTLSIQEILFFSAIEEHLTQIRFSPTDIEVHVSLANLYIDLSKLYYDCLKEVPFLNKRKKQAIDQKRIQTLKNAIEEFTILKEYAPNDPWIHAELAKAFEKLKMPKHQAKEYEQILNLRPEDMQVLYRLGVLYFQLGQNAKGLIIYEKLYTHGYKLSESLIGYYGKNLDLDFSKEELFLEDDKEDYYE